MAQKTPPEIPKRNFRALLMGSHSRGAMLHSIGAHALVARPAAPAVAVPNAPKSSPYLFGAPRPEVNS